MKNAFLILIAALAGTRAHAQAPEVPETSPLEQEIAETLADKPHLAQLPLRERLEIADRIANAVYRHKYLLRTTSQLQPLNLVLEGSDREDQIAALRIVAKHVYETPDAFYELDLNSLLYTGYEPYVSLNESGWENDPSFARFVRAHPRGGVIFVEGLSTLFHLQGKLQLSHVVNPVFVTLARAAITGRFDAPFAKGLNLGRWIIAFRSPGTRFSSKEHLFERQSEFAGFLKSNHFKGSDQNPMLPEVFSGALSEFVDFPSVGTCSRSLND